MNGNRSTLVSPQRPQTMTNTAPINGCSNNGTVESTMNKNCKSSKTSSVKSPNSNNSSVSDLSDKKKMPMNKIQVGGTPSPNLKEVKSKIGSLKNTSHKPGGGNVRIESKKLDFSESAKPRIQAKNDGYEKRGGEKKILSTKLQWSAKSKIGSLQNADYKPGGGEIKIETIKLDFKEKAKPKIGSKDNMNHAPGGGNVKIETKKLDFEAKSKIGSLNNVKHKAGGGDKKIFDDKNYLKQIQETLEVCVSNSLCYEMQPNKCICC